MNLLADASIDQLREMISRCDDAQNNHIVWVDTEGEVHVTPLPVELTPAEWNELHKESIRFRLETLHQGYGYVGPEAAADEQWMNRLYRSLTALWEQGAVGYREHF